MVDIAIFETIFSDNTEELKQRISRQIDDAEVFAIQPYEDKHLIFMRYELPGAPIATQLLAIENKDKNKDKYELVTAYPIALEGEKHRLKIRKVVQTDNWSGSTLTSIKNHPLQFSDPYYFFTPILASSYNEFLLAGFPLVFRKTDDEEIKSLRSDPLTKLLLYKINTGQLTDEKKEDIIDKLLEELTNGTADKILERLNHIISEASEPDESDNDDITDKLHLLMPERLESIMRFLGVIKQIDRFEVENQTIYRIYTAVMPTDKKNKVIPFYINAYKLEGYEPKVGDVVNGLVWLQGIADGMEDYVRSSQDTSL